MASSVEDPGPAPDPPTTVHEYHPAIHEQLEKDVWMLALGVRCINALCVATFFQPDEYFQSLEPAWQIAFGNDSGAWITWEWHNQLRSSLHPLLFATTYSAMGTAMTSLSFFPQLQAMVLMMVPKLLQGLFATAGDYYTWKLAEKVYGKGSATAWTALMMSLLSPWQWFCSTRTLSNSMETVLTIVALYYWPWILSEDATTVKHPKMVPASSRKDAADATSNQRSSLDESREVRGLRFCLLLAGTACILRPTNLLIWISLLFITFTPIILAGNKKPNISDLIILVREIIICGTAIILISAVSDRIYYGVWTFPPYQWLNFNITQSLAVFYGQNDWHYYLSQGLPLLLTTYLPFAILGLWSATSISPGAHSAFAADVRFQISVFTIIMIATLSCISHKEVRFAYPLLPGLHILAAPHLHSFLGGASMKSKYVDQSSPKGKPWRIYLLYLGIVVNISVGLYTTLVHQRGVIDVLGFLRQDYEATYFSRPGAPEYDEGQEVHYGTPRNLDLDPNHVFVAFLMPCHSTPWRSHLVHPTLRAWALTCEPPLHIPANSTARATYRDEADRFYDNPIDFLRREVNTAAKPWPQYVVGFEGIESSLQQYYSEAMPGWTVREKWRGFNTHWHDDRRRTGDVVVWEFVDGSN